MSFLASDKQRRIALNFNINEASILSSAQFSFWLNGNPNPHIPDTRDIIQGTLLFTLSGIEKNKNAKRGFINNFLRKRNLPLLANNQEQTLKDKGIKSSIMEAEKELDLIPGYETIEGRPGYVFLVNNDDSKIIDEIKKEIKNDTSINDIKDSEILRESIHFTFYDKNRRQYYMCASYLGNLYNLSPFLTQRILGTHIKLNKLELSVIEQTDLNRINLMRGDVSTLEAAISAIASNEAFTNYETFIELNNHFIMETNLFSPIRVILGFIYLVEGWARFGRVMIPELPTFLFSLKKNELKREVLEDLSIFSFWLNEFTEKIKSR